MNHTSFQFSCEFCFKETCSVNVCRNVCVNVCRNVYVNVCINVVNVCVNVCVFHWNKWQMLFKFLS